VEVAHAHTTEGDAGRGITISNTGVSLVGWIGDTGVSLVGWVGDPSISLAGCGAITSVDCRDGVAIILKCAPLSSAARHNR